MCSYFSLVILVQKDSDDESMAGSVGSGGDIARIVPDVPVSSGSTRATVRDHGEKLNKLTSALLHDVSPARICYRLYSC